MPTMDPLYALPSLSMHSGFSIYNTSCPLYMFIMHNAISTLIHLSLMPLGCNLNICWEVLTPLNLYVQVLKLGLKWSPPPKIKFSSQSRLTNLGSLRTRLFLPACGIFLQLVSILYSYCKFYFCTWL